MGEQRPSRATTVDSMLGVRSSRDPQGDPAIGRRAFLGIVAVGASSVFWGQSASSFVSRRLQGATSLLPEGMRAALPAPGVGWRIYSVNPPMPRFDPATWRLRIDGLVERPQV